MAFDHQRHMGVSKNVVYPIVPNGFADHYPVFKWLAIIGNIPYFQTNPHVINGNVELLKQSID